MKAIYKALRRLFFLGVVTGFCALSYYIVIKTQESEFYEVHKISHSPIGSAPLPTEYLAEVMGISINNSLIESRDGFALLEERLRLSSILESASLSFRKPDTLLVDYRVRQPVSYLAEYPGFAIDKEGYIFPVEGLITPKKIPQLLIGPSKIDQHSIVSKEFLDPLIEALNYFGQASTNVKSIDLTSMQASSYGRREIVVEYLIGEYHIFARLPAKPLAVDFKRLDRLQKALMNESEATYLLDLRLPKIAFWMQMS